ncbi:MULTISPECIES: oxidoreductase [unclassified Plantactinospora]|uniref:oxidoreductase n=1 Tax=unclassified Plantactinospora TaxID=2631981 RepID=UPI000D15887F|nr:MULTISPECIES: oxidoreductase [unclassified Plantactinospora]AVT31454.1 short-chain dehydrogenase/reductase [Plantactinospora sp. BC1]AVT38882.1 short-chain dehydrogenase/reductase [Plantactinospora sp. BB1]
MAKTWLITGSSRGLGRALSQEVLDRGDNLLATARQPEQLDDFVSRYGDQVRPYALDVTDPEAARAAVRTAVETFGGLDVVANNAGYANSAPIEEMAEEDFRAQVETNLFGVVNVTRAALPVLRARRSGHFLQFSSVGGRVGGTPGLGAYQAAKFAVEGFSEVLYNEVRPFGIRVTIVEPGAFRTDWGGASMRMAEVGEDYQQTVGRLHALRRDMDGQQAGDPERAARVIADLVGLAVPPLRLLLGSDALRLAEESARFRSREATAWADVSRSTDYDSSTDFAKTPVAAMLAPRSPN